MYPQQQNQSALGRSFSQGCGCAFGGCFGLILICSLVGAATVYGVYRGFAHAQQQRAEAERQAEQAAAQAFAAQFAEQLRRGADAYQLTTAEFRTRQSLEQFRDSLAEHRDLSAVRVQDVKFEPAEPNQKHTCRVILGSKDGGRVIAVLHLVRSDAEWQVDRMTLR